jgi:hypothetical protein
MYIGVLEPGNRQFGTADFFFKIPLDSVFICVILQR